MTCVHCKEADRVFNPRMGKSELKSYRRKGPSKSTRRIIEAVIATNRKGTTLIDIGGGVGAIYHELLNEFVSSAIHVDAAENYLSLARLESTRRGTQNRVQFIKGDFVDISTELPSSDIITLDKVVCCYPNIDSLLSTVASKSTGLVVLSLPREWLLIKFMVKTMNFVRKLSKNAFRNYVYSMSEISDILEKGGFTRTAFEVSGIWQIFVFEKVPENKKVFTS